MHEAAERVLGPERFAALGKAYRVSMPLKTDTVIDIAVKDSEAIGKDPKNLGWLVRLVGKPVRTPSGGEPPARSRAPGGTAGRGPGGRRAGGGHARAPAEQALRVGFDVAPRDPTATA